MNSVKVVTIGVHWCSEHCVNVGGSGYLLDNFL